ncbi:hypothetical protein C0J52_27332 [Blattella germanica]|nr:hypothetical protein C0J52_27332 [Blattella germanica]
MAKLLFLLKFLKIWVPDLNCITILPSLRPLSSSGDLLLLLVYGRNSPDHNLVTAVPSTSRFGPSGDLLFLLVLGRNSTALADIPCSLLKLGFLVSRLLLSSDLDSREFSIPSYVDVLVNNQHLRQSGRRRCFSKGRRFILGNSRVHSGNLPKYGLMLANLQQNSTIYNWSQ